MPDDGETVPKKARRGFPWSVSPELRTWISRRGTAVQKQWLDLHDRSMPRGLRERLNPQAHRARLRAQGLEAWYVPDDDETNEEHST